MPGDPAFMGPGPARNLAKQYADEGLTAYVWKDPVRTFTWHVEVGLPSDQFLRQADKLELELFGGKPAPVSFEAFEQTRKALEALPIPRAEEPVLRREQPPPAKVTELRVTAIQCVDTVVDHRPARTCSLVTDGTAKQVERVIDLHVTVVPESKVQTPLGVTYGFREPVLCRVTEEPSKLTAIRC